MNHRFFIAVDLEAVGNNTAAPFRDKTLMNGIPCDRGDVKQTLAALRLVSVGLRYFCIADEAYYVILVISIVVILILSPVEDKNKPLSEIEHKIYKKRTAIIVAAELATYLILKFVRLDHLSEAIIYSFAVLSFMLIVGKIKKEAKYG